MWKCGMKHDWRYVVTYQPSVTWPGNIYGEPFMSQQCTCVSGGPGRGEDLVLTMPGCVCPKVKDMGPSLPSRV